LDTRESNEWAVLSSFISELCRHYSRDLGENAYAIFNVITDFASHPPQNRNSLQKMAGSWLVDFYSRCRDPAFKLSDYLGPA
jgi:hypothetical protein